MKKYLFLLITICALVCMSVSAIPGLGGDVITGNDALSVSPEAVATADDLVTVAARLHSLMNGGSVDSSSDAEQCMAYALENGLIYDTLFEGDTSAYEVNRAEVAYVLGHVVTEEHLAPINDALLMPDSDPSNAYYKYALDFVNAGVIEGIDEYGSFGPGHPVKRYELSAILKRILNENERVAKDYIEYASDEPYYLIDDYLMGDTTSVRGIYNIASGWRYDYTGASEKARWSIQHTDDARNGYINTLRDLRTDDNMTISREIFPQKDGELVLETSFCITIGFAGMRFYLEDIDGNNIFEMGTYSSGIYYIDNTGRKTRYLSYPYSGTYKNDRKYYLLADPWRASDNTESTYKPSKQIRARLTINLDEGTVNVNFAGLNGTSYAYHNNYTYYLKSGYNGLAKIAFSTGISEQIEYTVKQVHLYKNYRVNDRFTTHKVNYEPHDYTTNGDVYVEEMRTSNDTQGDFYAVSVNVYEEESVYVRKNFKKIGGHVKLESYLLIPDGNDGVYFKVGYGDAEILKIVTHDKKFYTVDKNGNLDRELRFFTPNVWQCLRIEADTTKQTAIIKINGKVVAEDVPFNVKADMFSRLEFGVDNPTEGFTFWFDDVEVHELFDDYEDYVPEPVPLDTGDYILSMSVCNLWRNGSHYGWEYIAPHAEIEPITGYYDEGNSEAMDWEIKFLAEHGVSTYAMCWYAPTSPAVAPIKKPRMIDAHHEGYFNAKYTDYLDFSIMWENASYGDPGTSEKFKENIFPMWMDWYFSDPRYFRIEEDGKQYLFLTIYQWAKFRNMCLPAKAGVNSYNTDESYSALEFNQAEIDAAKLVSWMEQQVIDAGYADGIILCFTNNGSANSANTSMLNIAGSDTAIFPYAWGSMAYDLDNQKQTIENCYATSQKATNSLVTEQTGSYKGSEQGLDLLAMAAVGFNDVGWAQRRYPLMSDENFESLLYWLRDDYMTRYKDSEDSWKQRFIQFDTWNEYGEGHYIYPTVGLDPIPGTDYEGYGGYGYLEAMAKVFGKNYDAELHKELDIIPTQEQKERLGRLYVGNRMFIRREFLPDSMMETPIPEDVTVGFKFDSLNSGKQVSSYSGFQKQSNGLYYTYNTTEKALELKTAHANSNQSNPDPILHFDEKSKINGVSTKDCNILHVRMKSTIAGSNAQLFFRVDTMPRNEKGKTNFSEDYQYSFTMEDANIWHDYYIDLATHEGFTGNIEAVRFDTGNFADNIIYIQVIEFLKFSEEQKRTAITIDSVPYVMTDYWEIQEQSRQEIYIAPTDDNNFYKALHMVYDWHEDTGRLFLDTPDGTTLEFHVGSDKVVIDGTKEDVLDKTFYVYDGAPVLPLLYVLNTAGYKYTHDFANKTLDIMVADPVIFADIENATAEDETNTDAFYSISESEVMLVEDPDYPINHVWRALGKDNTYSYLCANTEFGADAEYTVEFDIMIDSLANSAYMLSEFSLNLCAAYSEGEGIVNHNISLGTVAAGKWVHVKKTFTVSKDRVEPEDGNEMIGIFFAPEDMWEADLRGVNFYLDNLIVRRPPATFEFKNGDAEDEDMSMWYASNTYCNRVWDDEVESWVIELAPVPDSGSAWSYLRQATKFEAGVTYYFSYDAKMGVDTYGTPVTTSFAINFRFNDLLQSHFTSNPYDHSITNYGVSQNDGWKHYTGSFTVGAGCTNNGVTKVGNVWKDEIAWYVNPLRVDGVYSPMTLRIDNIRFSTTPIE